MPSPDVSSYVDLTLFDVDSQQIYLNALEYARIALPEFQPVEGSIENVLLQAMALEVQDLATSINRLPSGIIQALLGILGVARQDATFSTGVVRLVSNVDYDYEVAAGVRFYSSLGVGVESLVIATDEPITMSRSKYLSTLSRSGTTVTVGTIDRHGLVESDEFSVTITAAGAAASAASGTSFTVDAVVDDYSFTYTTGTSGTINQVDLSETSSYLTVPSTVMPYGLVGVSSVVPGYAYLAQNSTLQLLSGVREIASSIMHSDLDGGLNAETDSEYFTRSSATLNRMTSALVTADQIAQYVASAPSFSYVYRVKATDNMDDQRTPDLAGSTLLTVAKIAASVSNQIEADDLTAIGNAVEPLTHPALTVYVDNAYFAKVSVVVTVVARSGFTSTQVTAAIRTALAEYLNPDTWDFSNVVYNSEISGVIRNATHNGDLVVKWVSSVELNVTSDNAANLANNSLSWTPYQNDDMNDRIEFDDPAPLLSFDLTGSSITIDTP